MGCAPSLTGLTAVGAGGGIVTGGLAAGCQIIDEAVPVAGIASTMAASSSSDPIPTMDVATVICDKCATVKGSALGAVVGGATGAGIFTFFGPN